MSNTEEQQSGSSDTAVPDEDFQMTAEMMVNDFDDERTLDEEEALEEAGGEQDEICDLEREKDIPLEDLLSMYGYNEEGGGGGGAGAGADEEEDEEEDAEGEGEDTPDEEVSEGDKVEPDEPDSNNEKPSSEDSGESEKKSEFLNDVLVEEEKPSRSMLHELYKDDPSVAPGSRQLRSGSRQASEDEEEEDDGDYSPEEDDWKKTIMVGSDYQAVIPDGIRKYGDAMPYENEDKLLWDPAGISDTSLSKYLSAVHEIHNTSVKEGVNSVPQGFHVRDDEQALYLLQQCGHNTEEATRRQKINMASSVDTMSLWSEEECRNFEAGLRHYGKDFNMIQQNKVDVRTRSVSELVQFYYLWKKTERHDVFANKSRLEKKKYTLHPGTTDFMERFLDEHEAPATSPNVHSLLAGDPKRQARTPPPVQSQPEMELITADEARIINTHFEDIARHLDKESLESLVKLAAAARIPATSSGEIPVAVSRGVSCLPCDSIVTHSAAHSYAQ